MTLVPGESKKGKKLNLCHSSKYIILDNIRTHFSCAVILLARHQESIHYPVRKSRGIKVFLDIPGRLPSNLSKDREWPLKQPCTWNHC